ISSLDLPYSSGSRLFGSSTWHWVYLVLASFIFAGSDFPLQSLALLQGGCPRVALFLWARVLWVVPESETRWLFDNFGPGVLIRFKRLNLVLGLDLWGPSLDLAVFKA
ncbi:20046_t:CDS:2, partial [Gigaspora rosea]